MKVNITLTIIADGDERHFKPRYVTLPVDLGMEPRADSILFSRGVEAVARKMGKMIGLTYEPNT